MGLGIAGCQNGQEAPVPEAEQETEEPAGSEVEDPESTSEGPPKLNSENAAEFLKEYGAEHSADEAVIHTPHGDIRIRLYDNTPLHRANFVYLARQDYFDGTWFYRISKDHVIQAGNTDNRETVQKRRAIGDYKVPSEIRPRNLHKRGAVAAARSYYQNPEKASDPFEFYIVTGKSYSRAELKAMEEQQDLDLSQHQFDVYSQQPGGPHLDGEHTVFGEVISGMEAVRAIHQVEIDEGEWPLTNIPIEVEIFD